MNGLEFGGDGAGFGDVGGGWAEVVERKGADLADGLAGGVEHGDAAAFLTAGVDLAGDEAAIAVEFGFEDHRQRQLGLEPKPAVGGEVAERIGDEAAFIELDAAEHMRPVAEHEIGTCIDDRAGKERQVSALLAKVHLGPVRHHLAARALGSPVK